MQIRLILLFCILSTSHIFLLGAAMGPDSMDVDDAAAGAVFVFGGRMPSKTGFGVPFETFVAATSSDDVDMFGVFPKPVIDTRAADVCEDGKAEAPSRAPTPVDFYGSPCPKAPTVRSYRAWRRRSESWDSACKRAVRMAVPGSTTSEGGRTRQNFHTGFRADGSEVEKSGKRRRK